MAINKRGLTRLGGSFNEAPSFWLYASVDSITNMQAIGYFNSAADVLRVNDLILLTDNTTPAKSFASVSAIANGVVTISDGVNI